jgi:hypothetical protein
MFVVKKRNAKYLKHHSYPINHRTDTKIQNFNLQTLGEVAGGRQPVACSLYVLLNMWKALLNF